MGKDPGVPVRRGRAYLHSEFSNLFVYVIEKAVQVSHDTIDKQSFEPFHYCVDDKIHKSAPFTGNRIQGEGLEQPDSRGISCIPMRTTPPPAMSCLIPCDFAYVLDKKPIEVQKNFAVPIRHLAIVSDRSGGYSGKSILPTKL